jgi:gamma-glutamyltranspeptidase/glutathione hydrolase
VPLTIDGRNPPEPGDLIYNPDLARVLRELGSLGPKEGFYMGETGKAIVDVVQKHGGHLTMDDLQSHSSMFPEAISADYRGHKLWQVPPNGQGIAGLIALTGLAYLEEEKVISPLSPESIGGTDSYHVMMEMMRLAYADATAHVGDPDTMHVTSEWLLDKERIGKRAVAMFDPSKATIHGAPDASSCTVSFQVVDDQGNAISFVNSHFMGFGSGIVPKGCGFTLQNRGFGFTLTDGHPNAPAPAKRPFHTIIPGIITHADTGELYATISNMGGNMQPQGHLQLTVNMLAGGLDPQAAIDMPRFCIADGTQGGTAYLESGIDERVVKELDALGHSLLPNIAGHERSVFGRAQIIKRDRRTGVLWAGSDGRADGCAIGY